MRNSVKGVIKRILWGISLCALFVSISAAEGHTAWVWTPESGKWSNPKNASKDTPEDQFAWAMSFYNQRQWDRAIEEFDKVPNNFQNSPLSAEAVYFSGLSWEEKEDLAKAADAYQKVIDKYPYSDRIKDAIKREFAIANEFASGSRVKVWGIAALSGQDKAVELYKHIVKNAPFGSHGVDAQFAIGELYKKIGEFEEAQKAYQAVVDNYPGSELVSKARYQIAEVSLEASKNAQYSEQSAQMAIEEFEGFKTSYPADGQAVQADEAIRALRAKKASTLYDTAFFYERQKKYPSAKVYYQEILTQYSETPAAVEARKRIDEILSEEGGTPKPSKPWYKLW